MSNNAIDYVPTKETMEEIAQLANEIVSVRRLSVEDMNQRIDRIAKSADVIASFISKKVREHVNQRLQGCGSLPFENDLAYRALIL